MQVFGQTIDDQTRCVHWNSPLDVIAIRFACCGRYYPCYECHAEAESHPAQQWPRERWNELAILCGVCQTEITIATYKATNDCPACGAAFNPGCHLHAHLYFER
ncbi:MAG TPA: CHY zinc finger protein [Thermomicrobiales bacterium]|nr:CHY zinc finger protein [Thermomicrobiales bacterium]